MKRKNSISLFLAATSALAISTAETNNLKAEENDFQRARPKSIDAVDNAESRYTDSEG